MLFAVPRYGSFPASRIAAAHTGLSVSLTYLEYASSITRVRRGGTADPLSLCSRMATAMVRHSYRGNEALEHHAFVGNTSLTYELPGVEEHDETEVPVYSHAALVEMVGEPSFVKIDCEGGEWGYLTDPTVLHVPRFRGEWHPVPYLGTGMTQNDLVALLPGHTVTFSGPEGGPGGFEAVRRG